MERNELAHYGILGMKWGVRRTEAQLARARGKSSNSSDNDSVKNMSDQELRSKINRIRMEQDYAKLTSSPSAMSAGQKFIAGILVGSATAVASSYTQKYMDKGAKWIGGQVIKGVKKVIKK